MKCKPKSFGVRLWVHFVLFAAVIFGALWLLQVVLLQNFYDRLVIKNVENVAMQIADQSDDVNLESVLDSMTYENSMLIFLTDRQGNILYGTDEHNDVYREDRSQHTTDSEKDNPYIDPDETLNWQIGARRNLSLPQNYDVFLQKLVESDNGTVGYPLDDSSTYIYGRILSSTDDDIVLYISTALEAVGATVSILRTLLIWVTVASLFLALAIALFLARRFSKPISIISIQAKNMADGNFNSKIEKGFCSEMDELADILSQTAVEFAKTDSFRREFLSNVSHDLRTPLTMIRGYAEMVRDISWEDEEKREVVISNSS